MKNEKHEQKTHPVVNITKINKTNRNKEDTSSQNACILNLNKNRTIHTYVVARTEIDENR
jgi:hypothetical protein